MPKAAIGRIACIALLLLGTGLPVAADVPVLRVGPAYRGDAERDGRPAEAYQSRMPSLGIRMAFLAEQAASETQGQPARRASSTFRSGDEVFFFVALDNVSRQPPGAEGARYAVALRLQLRDGEGTPLSDWFPIHTYTGEITMAPDDPDYFRNQVTGGFGPQLPPGQYRLALEFTDELREERIARRPVEVYFELNYVE